MSKGLMVLISLLVIGLALLCGFNVSNIPNNIEEKTINTTETKNKDISGDTTVSDTVDNQFKNIDKYNNVDENPIVTMEMSDGKIIKMELYPKVAPGTVENFIELVSSGFYNGLTFHRTIPGFMAQGGSSSNDSTGSIEYTIAGEFSSNGFENNLKHERGVLSMARAQDPNSAGSQFFIVVEDSLFLDGNYAAFGKVIEGMDVVDEIVNSEVIRREIDEDITTLEEYIKQMNECDKPVNPPVIKSMTVETFGTVYDKPTKIKTN